MFTMKCATAHFSYDIKQLSIESSFPVCCAPSGRLLEPNLRGVKSTFQEFQSSV